MSKNNPPIKIQPIGFFSTDYSPETGAPRQGAIAPEGKGIIKINNEFKDGLYRLSEYEYIWVMFHFSEKEGWSSIVRPPSSDEEFGVFATRSPRRPNGIGLTLVKLNNIDDSRLYISRVDAFDGTPVIDIKPYLPSIDSVESSKNSEAEILLTLKKEGDGPRYDK